MYYYYFIPCSSVIKSVNFEIHTIKTLSNNRKAKIKQRGKYFIGKSQFLFYVLPQNTREVKSTYQKYSTFLIRSKAFIFVHLLVALTYTKINLLYSN